MDFPSLDRHDWVVRDSLAFPFVAILLSVLLIRGLRSVWTWMVCSPNPKVMIIKNSEILGKASNSGDGDTWINISVKRDGRGSGKGTLSMDFRHYPNERFDAHIDAVCLKNACL